MLRERPEPLPEKERLLFENDMLRKKLRDLEKRGPAGASSPIAPLPVDAGPCGYWEWESPKSGHWVWGVEPESCNNALQMAGSRQKTTKQKKTEETPKRTLAFERLVTALSSHSIIMPSTQIDTMIQSTLQLIGELLEADRCYFVRFNNSLSRMSNTHEWCQEGIEAQIHNLQEIPTDSCPWWMEQIKNNQIIHLPQISGMTNASSLEKTLLASRQVKSLMLIPLFSGPRPFGYLGCDAVQREREWPPETVSMLRVAGGIIINALQRNQLERFIQAELDLAQKLTESTSVDETLQHCMQSALSVSGMDSGGLYLINHEEETLTLACHTGLPQSFIDLVTLYSFDLPPTQRVLQGKPLYLPISAFGSNVQESIRHEKLQSIACLPISCKGKVIACLNVASHTIPEVPESARECLENLMTHIGAAIVQALHEEEIAETKKNLESLFETIDDLFFIADIDGEIMHTNEAFRKKPGYSAAELHAKPFMHMHPEDRRDEAKELVEGMVARSCTTSFIPLLTSAKKLIPVETKITRGVWNNKPVLFGISRDKSEQLRSELALTESEKRFRELTDMLPLPLFELDAKGVLTYANRKVMELFGYNTPEALRRGVSSFHFCIPKEWEKAFANFEAMKPENYHSKGNEYTAVKSNGQHFPALFYSSPIRQHGLFNGIRSIIIDLTELKKAEEALRSRAMQERSLKEFKTLISNIPGAVYRINNSGKITIISMASDFFQDYSRKELEKGLFGTMTIIHPDDRDIVAASNLALRKAKTSRSFTYRILTKNGSVRWIEDRKTYAFSPEGIFTGIDGILFDITERIQAQEKKQQLESRLRQSQRLETIGTLAGGIAHDFNNLLMPILGYAELGVFDLDKEEPLHDYFLEIMKAAERAKNLVSQILMFSKSQEYTPEVVSVQAVMDEALKLLRPSIPATITIQPRIDYGCRNILGDSSQLHQVIINLCTNAFHAMEESGGVLGIELKEITIDSSRKRIVPELDAGDYLLLRISDTGFGMQECTMERIFEPFFTTKSVNKGTGLGLSVVHGIVTSFKGEITVESLPGKGTTFRVYFPVIDTKPLRATTEETPAKGNGSILFVDDEPATLKLMTTMMTKLGFNIEALSSPLKALERFQQNPEQFDLIITDLTMPEMTGIELARELYQIRPTLPVILITGYEKDREESSPLAQYGICKFLKKPVKLTEMASIINEVMSSNNPYLKQS